MNLSPTRIKRSCLVLSALGLLLVKSNPASAERFYMGICDGSASIALNNQHMIVADDEGNDLKLYPIDPENHAPGKTSPIQFKGSNLAELLDLPAKDTELDIEGAAKIGNTIYWITSHARNSKGKLKLPRYRLFATEITGSGTKFGLKLVGQYKNLASDFNKHGNWNTEEFSEIDRINQSISFKKKEVPDLAPKIDGFNIEALAAKPDSDQLFVGIRNPLSIDGKAMIIPISNAHKLVTNPFAQARFDAPIKLDLHGLGIRGMEFNQQTGKFYIIAGPNQKKGKFKLFQWDGKISSSPGLIKTLKSGKNKSPESVNIYPDYNIIQILNDLGNKKIKDRACKHPKTSKNKRRFSDQWVDIN